MKKLALLITLVSINMSCFNAIALAEIWKLPLDVSDSNTKVSFDIDTTWHVVHGQLKNITGTIEQTDNLNPLSIASEIHFPVKSFKTGWNMRDDSLHEHMNADEFPEAVSKTIAVRGTCTPDTLPCDLKLKGTLTICNISKDITIDVKMEKHASDYKVSGKYSFEWAQYNIKDPSMFAAKVEPVVEVKYSVILPGE